LSPEITVILFDPGIHIFSHVRTGSNGENVGTVVGAVGNMGGGPITCNGQIKKERQKNREMSDAPDKQRIL